MPRKLNHEDVVRRIEQIHGDQFEFLSEYNGMWNILIIRHKKCNQIFKRTPAHLINRKRGCNKCGKFLRLTNDVIDKKLSPEIERVSESKGALINIKWRCKNQKCKFEWFATPNNVLNKNSGCPKCANSAPLTNKIVDDILKQQRRDHLIMRTGNVSGASNNCTWKCKIKTCLFEWKARTSSILHGKTGCPHCNLSHGALETERVLKIHFPQYKYSFEYWFDDLVNPKTLEHLYFDFVVYDDNSEIVCLIEYQGHYHYKPIKFAHGGVITLEEALIKLQGQQYRDQLKRDYCKENEILLIEIPYWEYEKGNLENYLLEKMR